MGACICLRHSPTTWVQRHLGGAWSFQLCSLCCGAWKLQTCASSKSLSQGWQLLNVSEICRTFLKGGWIKPKKCLRRFQRPWPDDTGLPAGQKECKKDCDIHYAGLETAFSNCSNGFRFRNVFEPLLRSWPFLSKRLWSVLIRCNCLARWLKRVAPRA